MCDTAPLIRPFRKLLSLVVICRRATCDIAAGTPCDTVPMSTEVAGNIGHVSLYRRHVCEVYSS